MGLTSLQVCDGFSSKMESIQRKLSQWLRRCIFLETCTPKVRRANDQAFLLPPEQRYSFRENWAKFILQCSQSPSEK